MRYRVDSDELSECAEIVQGNVRVLQFTFGGIVPKEFAKDCKINYDVFVEKSLERNLHYEALLFRLNFGCPMEWGDIAPLRNFESELDSMCLDFR